MIRALIFDFDGLIIDTELPAYQSWQEVFSSYGQHLPLALWSSTIGTMHDPFDPLDYLEKQTDQPLDRPGIRQQRRQREAELISAQPVRPGLVEYLAEARRQGLRLGVASSSTNRWVTGYLEERGLLDYFDCLRTREDVALTKPAPDLFLAALAGLSVEAAEALAFEDSPKGVLAAQTAGLFCVAVPNDVTRQLPLEHADLILPDFKALPLAELLRQVNAGLLPRRIRLPGEVTRLPWQELTYLTAGTPRQQAACRALLELGLFHTLSAFSPVLTGDLPLALDLPDGALDITCAAPDLEAFIRQATAAFAHLDGFRINRRSGAEQPSASVRFAYAGFLLELSARPRPVAEQEAYRHMLVEARLLELGGAAARAAIRWLRAEGWSTASAFAHYFGLAGDPDLALLELSRLSDAQLRAAVKIPNQTYAD
jgi:HAD superfamily hydrolase (TIGR01509 family)